MLFINDIIVKNDNYNNLIDFNIFADEIFCIYNHQYSQSNILELRYGDVGHPYRKFLQL